MSSLLFHLLELNVISAQDLAPVSKTLRTYAVAWVHTQRKLRTRIDHQGRTNPTWNDKFVFRVDDKFMNSETSAVMIEIYAVGWLRDIQVGSVRVLVSNLIPRFVRKRQKNSSRRFVALQIKRPSGRPQGILNMGVTLLDNTMRSMPLYTELSASAVGYQDLMDEKKHKYNKHTNQKQQVEKSNNKQQKSTKIDQKKQPNSKIVLRRSQSDQTSLNNGGFSTKAPKESSICGGSILNGSVHNRSILNGSIYNGSMVNGSLCSDVGPSPSLVAAAMAKGLYPTPMAAVDKPGSSILEDWTVEDSSVEGLKSKIERWRMEVPPIYDCDYQKVTRTPRKHSRRHTLDGGGKLFSCFGNAYGCEFTIVCGGNGNKKNRVRCGSEVEFDPSELDL